MKTAGRTEQMLEVRSDEKTNCLTTVQKDNYITYGIPKGTRAPIRDFRMLPNKNTTKSGTTYYRKLSPLECERLQTLPDNYTEGVSNTQRYKMASNGWAIDVVSYILSHLTKLKD